ncbi:MAG: DegT/DnrJ/EryC1/StrS family aminotransferase [Chromatiales bacterium]|nr:DegT/DnrJ/EryC1/StrS family aminotransferase [Chromatiales bacterium]
MTEATNESIPFLDLGAEFAALGDEWLRRVRSLGARGAFILGPAVEAFEKEVAEYVGVSQAVGVANGTDALILALRALGIGAGDEVITTPYTFFASAEAVSAVGATPVFADIRADDFTLDAQSVATKVTPRTRAILPVHLFGAPADMDGLATVAARHDLAIVEDCAQAFGAEVGGRRVGAIGTVGCFSFYPTKVLGCYGDGGLVTTGDPALAARIRHLRNHGATAPFMHDAVGMNSRLDAIQAELLRIKLGRIEGAIGGRIGAARDYDEALAGTAVVTPPRPVRGRHVFNLYTIRAPRRDALRELLTAAGVPTSLCYPAPLHVQAVYAHLGYSAGSLPVAEQASREALSLPIYPNLPAAHVDRIAGVIRASA